MMTYVYIGRVVNTSTILTGIEIDHIVELDVLRDCNYLKSRHKFSPSPTYATASMMATSKQEAFDPKML